MFCWFSKMARICTRSHIIHLLFVQLIFLIAIKADYSTYYNNITINNDSMRSDRSKRSPTDNDPRKLEAMIINENGKFIHLQWMKARQTLANEHLPIWTAHLNNWGTYHKLHPELSRAVGGFVAYHDLEQNSAVLYDTHRKTLSGSIGTKYHITGLPITLLHQCHKVKGPYLKIGRHVSHRTTDHPEPPNDVIGRFENCGERSSLSDISPFSSQKPHSSENSIFKTKEKKCDKDKFNKRDIDSIHQNATKIRKRREQPEHFYIEILLFVPHSIVIYYKNLLLERYLLGIIRFHLLYFNSIDMLYANLQTNDLHIHINLAGIIIEDDKGAFDSVIDYSKHAIKPHLGELYYSRFLRYLEYYDLPYEKDSIDLIFITNSHQVLSEHHAKPLGGLTRNDINRYRTRQIYKRIDNVPLTIAIFTGNLYEYCVGAHEIGHALMIPHDPSDIELMKNGQCYGIMQISGPNCVSCINWSHESINSLQDFTRFHKDRCFLLNYPRSLNPPGPRVTLSPCRQCQCYGYEFYGQEGECLSQVPASDCGKRLQCKSAYHNPNSLNLLILPLDGTPCGDNKVCWIGNCVDI